ncbi:hypothetical protein CGLO_04940 [Colletotrichum gloeosporioides Cg-14]|uniref:Uncharacterized protein n=1 Tax=Colletotrichum gloeosporioides (strain Cg-14) TaxID=1237896 RepID=T0KR74_COLGC|nr:hypothetical protein CGLO_04940 [Colletotrichum gloeosporioides Cg-14]
MRPLQILILVLQGSLAAEAASWTLHESCYRKEVFENGNPSKKITVDDKELENAILKGVEAKAWATAAASHIKDSMSKNPLKGRTVKTALEPLLVKDDYNKAAGDVKSKFDNIATMKGPVGREGNENGRYEKSSAWAALKKSDDHHFNFFFHSTSFGAMFDDMDPAYGWANNVKTKNHENPDLYSLIAAVIHLLYKEGTNYKVTAEGHSKVKAP